MNIFCFGLVWISKIPGGILRAAMAENQQFQQKDTNQILTLSLTNATSPPFPVLSTSAHQEHTLASSLNRKHKRPSLGCLTNTIVVCNIMCGIGLHH